MSEEEKINKIRVLFEKKMKEANPIVDITEYPENDYIVHLAQLHHEKDKLESVKYYQRKRNKTELLEPIKKKIPKKPDPESFTSANLFRNFKTAGNLDKPEL